MAFEGLGGDVVKESVCAKSRPGGTIHSERSAGKTGLGDTVKAPEGAFDTAS